MIVQELMFPKMVNLYVNRIHLPKTQDMLILIENYRKELSIFIHTKYFIQASLISKQALNNEYQKQIGGIDFEMAKYIYQMIKIGNSFQKRDPKLAMKLHLGSIMERLIYS